VDDWVNTPFESGPAAVEDLIARVSTALARRDAGVVPPADRAVIEDGAELAGPS